MDTLKQAAWQLRIANMKLRTAVEQFTAATNNGNARVRQIITDHRKPVTPRLQVVSHEK